MNVHVEKCFGGTYCLTVASLRSPYYGKRYVVRGDSYGDWSRSVATEAKRIVAVETGADMTEIRFSHR